MSKITPLPEAFLARIKQTFPDEETDLLVEHLDLPPINSVRLNPRKAGNVFADAEVVPWCKHGLYLPERPLFTLDPLFHAGVYYPQEASSMFLWYLLETLIDPVEKNDLKILDLCGAPGGKASLLASFLDGYGLLVTNEVIRSRADILNENMQKWGAPNVIVTRSDPSKFSGLNGLFDILVVDAPCSGEGMFRKGDTARKEWSEENAALCATRQRRILRDAWPALKEGGLLIYSTCTFNPAENEENLNWLIKQQNAKIIPLNPPGQWGITPIPVANGNALAFYPHKTKGEGFFIAAIRKTDAQNSLKRIKGKKKSKVSVPSAITSLLKNPDFFCFFNIEGKWVSFPKAYEYHLNELKNHLDILNFGTVIGQVHRNKIMPEPSLAHNWEFSNLFPTYELNKELTLHYLKGETLPANQELPQGINTVTYNNIPLGFVKNVGNRCNNLFPKKWRIRMAI